MVSYYNIMAIELATSIHCKNKGGNFTPKIGVFISSHIAPGF